MTIIVHPVFKVKGMLSLNPENHYIIDNVAWVKGDNPENIIAAGIVASELRKIGFEPVTDLYEAEADKHKVYQVAILNHPTLGELRIGIVSGPDFNAIKSSLDEDYDDIIKEKAQFTLNIHDTHGTTQ